MSELHTATFHDDRHFRRSRLVGMLCAFFAMIIFGSTFPMNKFVMERQVDPILMAFLRAVMASLFLLPFYAMEEHKRKMTHYEWKTVFFIGGGAAALAQVLEYTGTKYTSASNASLIISSEAVISMLLAVWLLKEALRPSTILGAVLAVGGMLMVMLDDIRTLEFHLETELKGDLLVLLSVLCWGLYTVFSKKALKTLMPMAALLFVCISSSMTLGLYCLMAGSLPQVKEFSRNAWIGLVYLGIFGSGLGHILYFQALKRLPASIVSLTLTLIPVCGVALAMLMSFTEVIPEESLSLTQIIGGLIIILGVGYAVWPRERKEDREIEITPAFESVQK